MSSAWSRAWESTRDWLGVATPTSHGSMPTQWLETHCGVGALGLVSVSQADQSCLALGDRHQARSDSQRHAALSRPGDAIC